MSLHENINIIIKSRGMNSIIPQGKQTTKK